MAETRGVIDVVCAEEARRFLRHVIDFVRHAACGDEEGEAARVARSNAFCDARTGVVPRDATKAAITMFAQEGAGDATEFAKLRIVHRRHERGVLELANVERGHRVQAKQIQARHAEMRAGDGPVVQSSDAERAAIAHALGDDLPRVAEVVAVLPDDADHVAEMLGLGAANAEGQERLEPVREGSLDAMRHAREWKQGASGESTESLALELTLYPQAP